MTPTTKGILLTLAACVGASAFLVAWKVAAAQGPASDAVVIMLAFAAVLNSVATGLQNGLRAVVRVDRLSFFLASGFALLTLAGNRLVVEAVARISAPLTSVMQQTQVFFVAVLGGIFLAEVVSVRFWMGALVATAGLAILHLSPGAALELDALGTTMAVGSAVCWATMALFTRRYIHDIVPVAVNALRLWMAVALWFVIHRRLPAVDEVGTSFVFYCGLAAFCGPFFARMALMYALRYIRPSDTTLIGLMSPLSTLAVAFFAFGTVPSVREMIGGAIMLVGIAVPVLELRARAATGAAPAE